MGRIVTLLRRVLVAVLLLTGVGLLLHARLSLVPWPSLYGPAALILAMVALAPDLARPVAEWLGNLAAGLFFPNRRFEKPPLSYRLAEFYVREKRWEEAIEQYAGIVRHYPEERHACEELIRLARDQGEPRLANRYERLLRRRFSSRREGGDRQGT